uniref:Uncharacterized protein n=1 Tax=Anopheles christyi TaxID=43041 RepID=A0A182KIP4_9DIPT
MEIRCRGYPYSNHVSRTQRTWLHTYRTAVVEHVHEHRFSTANAAVDVQSLGCVYRPFRLAKVEPFPYASGRFRWVVGFNTIIHYLQGFGNANLMRIGLYLTMVKLFLQQLDGRFPHGRHGRPTVGGGGGSVGTVQPYALYKRARTATG